MKVKDERILWLVNTLHDYRVSGDAPTTAMERALGAFDVRYDADMLTMVAEGSEAAVRYLDALADHAKRAIEANQQEYAKEKKLCELNYCDDHFNKMQRLNGAYEAYEEMLRVIKTVRAGHKLKTL